MHERPAWPYVIGFSALALALFSPLETVAETTLSAHMAQHLLLMCVTAPCFAVARPLPPRLRRALPPLDIGWLVTAAVLQVSVLLAWHVPALFDAAAAHEPLHAVEHVTLLGAAFVLWTCLLDGEGLARPLGVLVLFLSSLAPMIYGVGLTLASSPWYSRYESIPDQRIAGWLARGATS
jgi:cytochrome c oxidase assembly factor CtaG